MVVESSALSALLAALRRHGVTHAALAAATTYAAFKVLKSLGNSSRSQPSANAITDHVRSFAGRYHTDFDADHVVRRVLAFDRGRLDHLPVYSPEEVRRGLIPNELAAGSGPRLRRSSKRSYAYSKERAAVKEAASMAQQAEINAVQAAFEAIEGRLSREEGKKSEKSEVSNLNKRRVFEK